MKRIFWFLVLIIVAHTSRGQTSQAERTGLWTSGASWVGGTIPGSWSGGTITVTSQTVVINGTIEAIDNVSVNLSNLSINTGDTLVILGDLNVNLSSFTNNGVLIVFGNLSNTLSNNSISGSGKLVVTGDYSNAFGANTLTGPSYVYGSTPGFFPAPSVGDESDLQSNDPGLYSYVNNIFSVLPVELISFDAKAVDDHVELSWVTASESNNDYFIVERSTDGENFSPLMDIPGVGTSTQEQRYWEVDSYPAIGLSYYRLTQVDYDGKFEVLQTVSVLFDEPIQPEIYPNPTSDYVSIEVNPEDYSVSLRDLKGWAVPGIFMENEYQGRLHLDLRSLEAGVYILQLFNIKSSKRLQYRLIKQ